MNILAGYNDLGNRLVPIKQQRVGLGVFRGWKVNSSL